MDDDEFDFSGHELDELPADQWDELETTAIQATQHATQHPVRYLVQPEDDYGGFDDDGGDEVINLDDVQQNYDYNSNHNDHNPAHNNGYGDTIDVPRQSQADPSQLLQRIKQLELGKRELAIRLQTATDEANKKAGEADNLRRRVETERRAAEQRQQALERQHKEASDKLKADRDNVQRQLEQTKTSNAFEEHDARQAEQTRRARRAVPIPMPTRSKPAAATATTPKKAAQTLQLGDGFDDDGDDNGNPMAVDVHVPSPTRRRERIKAATPRHKRKRQPTNDSPVPALQLSAPREREPEREATKQAGPSGETTKVHVALLRSLCRDDSRYALLHRLLAHRCDNGKDRVLEALSQHAFPSQPEKKLSSIVYDSLSGLPGRVSSTARELALRICHVFFGLWGQCLREKYYPPVFLILDALHFVLACEPANTAVATTDHIVPLIIESIDLVATPVLEAANRQPARVAALYSPQQQTIASEINVDACLDLLYLVATSCVSSPSVEHLALFWRAMPYTHVLLLLHRNQPLSQIQMMLRILATSALPTSIGPMGTKSRDQQAVETDIIIRLTMLFSEAIEPIPNPQLSSSAAIPEAQIWQLRLKTLDVLSQFSISDHGCAKLASDNYCIGRLVKYLNHCVSSLYSRPLSPTQALKIASVNATMKLIHHVVTRTETPIKNKLKGVEHAYHVALTRITFSDRLVLEEGIESQVIDMAHHILDEDVGPEEGEALLEVFPSGNSA